MNITTFNLLTAFDNFETHTYNNISRHNQQVRKACGNFENFTARNDRCFMASEALEELQNYLSQINDCLNKEEDRLEAIAVARYRITERTDILKQLHLFVKAAPDEQSIQEKMNARFENEYRWKKELPIEFLRVLRSYDNKPDTDKRENLLMRIATLMKASICKVATSSGSYIADIAEMPSESLTAERKKTRENIQKIMDISSRAGKLRQLLLKIEADF